MGLSKTGEVYRFDWITLVSQGHNLFKLVSNGGTEVKELKGADAAKVRDEVKDTVVCMSPQFGMTRSDKMNLPTSRVSLSVVAHMKTADISQDNSTAELRKCPHRRLAEECPHNVRVCVCVRACVCVCVSVAIWLRTYGFFSGLGAYGFFKFGDLSKCSRLLGSYHMLCA